MGGALKFSPKSFESTLFWHPLFWYLTVVYFYHFCPMGWELVDYSQIGLIESSKRPIYTHHTQPKLGSLYLAYSIEKYQSFTLWKSIISLLRQRDSWYTLIRVLTVSTSPGSNALVFSLCYSVSLQLQEHWSAIKCF